MEEPGMLRIQMDAVLMSPIGIERAWEGGGVEPERVTRTASQDFSLASESFEDGGVIPDRLAEERGVSPQLSWRNVLEDTSRLVIIMDDPDARPVVGHTFVHWVAMVPRFCTSLEEGASAGGWTGEPKVLSGDSFSTAYKGPKPPSGTHRYHIAIYAMSGEFDAPEFQELMAVADDTKTCSRKLFEDLYHREILATAEITGTYSAKPMASH
jgi:Raf kinase inhibitor-like YbhB/YbcL family protein